MSLGGFDQAQNRWRADRFPHSEWDVSRLRWAGMARAEHEDTDLYPRTEDRRRSDGFYEKVR